MENLIYVVCCTRDLQHGAIAMTPCHLKGSNTFCHCLPLVTYQETMTTHSSPYYYNYSLTSLKVTGVVKAEPLGLASFEEARSRMETCKSLISKTDHRMFDISLPEGWSWNDKGLDFTIQAMYVKDLVGKLF